MSTTSQTLAMHAASSYAKLNGNAQGALDPATIMTFAQLIMEAIAKFKECKTSPGNAVQQMKSPGLFQRIQLRRTVKDAIGNSAFRQHGDNLVEALLDTGSKVSVEDVNNLYKELD